MIRRRARPDQDRSGRLRDEFPLVASVADSKSWAATRMAASSGSAARSDVTSGRGAWALSRNLTCGHTRTNRAQASAAPPNGPHVAAHGDRIHRRNSSNDRRSPAIRLAAIGKVSGSDLASGESHVDAMSIAEAIEDQTYLRATTAWLDRLDNRPDWYTSRATLTK
jgi:hypothetical protein